MKLLKRILLLLLVIAVAMYLSKLGYETYQKPVLEGTIESSEINSETTVYFDEYGIPHIYGSNELDALTALGYVHAQDRLWQMELLRRIAPGRLSEILGEPTVETDTFFANIGIDEASEKAIQALDKNGEAYLKAQAYLNGVNDFLKNGATPIEFTLLGVEPEPFTIKDSYNILGYMAFSFAMAHKTDPLLTALHQKLGMEYMSDLPIDINPETTLIKTTKKESETYAKTVASIHNALNNSPMPPFIGSNSWVIGPEKTASGKVILANDPHIGFAQPAVWYEAHIEVPNYSMYGYYMAGIPFPLLGHNKNLAYGITMFENDDIDFYREELHPSDSTKYRFKEEYFDFDTSEKTIKVKDADPIQITVRKTNHGPVINSNVETISEESPISMSWVFTKYESHVLEALHQISIATNKEEFKKGVSLIHAPGLNMMYGDATGNIGWWAAGKLYTFNEHVNPKFILDGASGNDEPIEVLDFGQNPTAQNPPWHYVYSANNQPDSIAGMLYPGYYLPEDRAKRIVELLDPKNNWTKEDVQLMINDHVSAVAPNNVAQIIASIEQKDLNSKEKEALEILKSWDGSNAEDNIASTIYSKWLYQYLELTFQDEMGEEYFQQFLKTHLVKRTVAHVLKNDTSIWWDNSKTEIVETKDDILLLSFKKSVHLLLNQFGENQSTWMWGKVHTLEHQHPIGSQAVLQSIFNVGPFPMKGAKEVIDNRGYDYSNTGLYQIKSGPSTRRVIDFSDIENSVSILPTGQSGNPFSPHYQDQAAMFNAGQFRKMKMNKEEILDNSTKLIFLPTNE